MSSAPIGALPDDFSAKFDLHEEDGPSSIIQIATFFDRALIERLHKYSEDLRRIDRRSFEQLIAELFSGFGYEVELT